jgi:aminopeptidase N
MQTILGEEKFRAGADLYFERHDGQAVTCEDFVKAMEDASGVDLSGFRLWYEQAGTPKVTARLEHDAAARTATLHLTQSVPPTPGQDAKQPMPIPLRTALIGGDSGAEVAAERLILLDQAETKVEFAGIDEPPLLSINRGFSAPVIVEATRRAGELERLAASDSDPFARYEAMQELMLRVLIAGAKGGPADTEPVIAAFRGTLASNALDAAFKGEALTMPSDSLIGDRMDKVDPDAIHAARDALRAAVGRALSRELSAAQSASAPGSDLSSDAKGIRRLKTVALGLLASGDAAAGAALAKAQYDGADNMTDRQGALGVLVSLDAAQRGQALDDFYDRYRGDTLVMDKWFGLQAAAQRADTLEQVRRLADHAEFTLANPNRARALIGSFSMNQWAFHRQGGDGYRFVADMILALDQVNPQVAARLVPPLGRWRRFAEDRAGLMRTELERILKAPGLSKDVYELASKSLA